MGAYRRFRSHCLWVPLTVRVPLSEGCFRSQFQHLKLESSVSVPEAELSTNDGQLKSLSLSSNVMRYAPFFFFELIAGLGSPCEDRLKK